jgi:hypothetical protein
MDVHSEPLMKRRPNIPERAKYPVIDAHNHLFGEYGTDAEPAL